MSLLLPGFQPPSSDEHPVYARSGWRIPTEQVEVIPRLVQIRADELLSWRKNLTLRSASPHSYNCVGMIFAARRVWIEMDYIYDLLREDSYRRIQPTEIMIGDVVIYKTANGEPTHIGLIVLIDRSLGLSIKVLSKWGKDAEFIHFIEDVPDLFGVPSEYWTDRPYETR